MSEENQRRLIVGLGNPGEAYDETRHNIGFLALRRFAEKNGFIFHRGASFSGEIAQGRVKDKKAVLLLPLTYMNSSGRAVFACASYFEIRPENILIVCDEIALPFGKLRLKPKGSAGGHNGLKSVEAHLGTQDYHRLRIGVGDRSGGQSLAEHVLGRFTAEEKKELPKVIDEAAQAVEIWLTEDIDAAMRKVNVTKGE